MTLQKIKETKECMDSGRIKPSDVMNLLDMFIIYLEDLEENEHVCQCGSKLVTIEEATVLAVKFDDWEEGQYYSLVDAVAERPIIYTIRDDIIYLINGDILVEASITYNWLKRQLWEVVEC